ncbi:UV-stimulated scaffold protein A isoform X2 [Gadus chalcogrammus]|uniref:UV-stimulated scaffold protein A isoform X2 n=1 Tax=Gadus chalcogrammus TaxID=1042646 RepID=UPI0024C4E3BB|nr:UV-stimulated scaffold protein A isoform X2 [Gadus chalcogrammus]
MDLAQRDKLSELVEELTTSGQQQLNQEKIKEIKKICRLSKDYVDHVYDSVMAQLDKEHAEIRLSAFQIASELFSRSHQFRIRLVDNFQEFLELTVETDSDQPLPPPKEVAKKLKISAIKTIQSWQAQYGTAYKKLALGYHFMKQVKNVDFNDVQARTVAERSRENERQRRMERIYKDRVEAAAKEMEDVQVKETDDNEAVVSTLIELHHLITTKHLPAVKSWVQVFTRSGPEQLQLLRSALRLKMSLESLLKKEKLLHIDYKTRIRKVTRATADVEEDDEEEDEDDFEEVPEKEGFEPHIPDHLREEYGLEPSASTSAAPPTQRALPKRPAPVVSPSTTARRLRRRLEEERDPTCAAATLHLLKGQMRPCTGPSPRVSEPPSPAVGSAPAGGDGAPDAPIVPFGLDLYYWGEKQPAAGKMIKSTSQHRFWVPSEVDEETENPELLAESSSRYISFPGTFTPVSHHCNALLGNGRLCPRQDRVKCPFHGVIVPRDAHGRPSRAEDRAREEREERRHRESHPDWQDVELMQDIEAATGEDLGSKRLLGKGQGKGKGKYPNLSNLKKSANTSRSRLENKVFNKKSVRRVSEVMTKIDSRKHEKFSNQFNYALN